MVDVPRLFKAFLVFLLYQTQVCQGQISTIVTIPDGSKVGGRIVSFSDNPANKYYQYKGIPYANSVGRFELSQMKSPWEETHDGTIEGKVCPQPLEQVLYPFNTDEHECLVLSVSTPNDPNSMICETKQPVLVFIHGGLFVFGTSQSDWYDPEPYLTEGIITVNIQYRLGTLGWITDGNIIPKNIGLKDCLLALQWVNLNIGAFCGDKNAVTINGESAGAVITSTLWQAPKAAGLFDKVILQSGSALNVWGYQPDPAKAFQDVINNGPCVLTKYCSVEEQVECLRTADVSLLGVENLGITGINDIVAGQIIDGATYAVVLEDEEDPTSLMTKTGYQRLINGDFPKNHPMITAMTNEEGLTFAAGLDPLRLQANYNFAPAGIYPQNRNYIGGQIKQYYAGGQFGWTFAPKSTLVKFASDLLFDNAFRKNIELIQPQLNPGVGLYCLQFSYESPMGIFHENGRVGHAEELFYLWRLNVYGQEDLRKATYPPRAFLMRQQMCRLFANFVKNGNPTPEVDPLLQNKIWPRITNVGDVKCLDINDEFTFVTNVGQSSYQKWTDWYYGYGMPVNVF